MIESVVIIAEKLMTQNEFLNFDEFLVKEKKRRRNFLRKMKNHEQRRVIDDFFVFVSISMRDLIFFITRVSMSFRNVVVFFTFFRISKTLRRRNVIETKFDESFITRFVIEEKNENEFINKNDDEFSNCVKCYRVSMSCRRVNDIACAKCLRQKQVYVLICFRFTFFFEDFLLIAVDFYSI
jgi:predicted NUDIX family phosphoesterase